MIYQSILTYLKIKYPNGRRVKLSLIKNIYKIAEFFDVSTDYLLNDNIPVVCNDLSLSNAKIISSNEIYSVPVYESVSAGLGRAAISEPIGYHPLYIKNPADVDNMFCVMVNGDSMYPIINDGDMIVVHRQSQVENAQIAVIYVKDKDEALVKKFYHDKNYIELVSVNPMYPPIHLEGNKMNDICIQGLVKQVIKNV